MRLARLMGLTTIVLFAWAANASAVLAPVVLKESGQPVPVGTPVEAIVSIEVQSPVKVKCSQVLTGTLISNSRTKDVASLTQSNRLLGECADFTHTAGKAPSFHIAHGKAGEPNVLGLYGTGNTWTFRPDPECTYFIAPNLGTISFPGAPEWTTVAEHETWPRKPICPAAFIVTRGVLIDPSHPLSENIFAELGPGTV